jgi:hypothetical protein
MPVVSSTVPRYKTAHNSAVEDQAQDDCEIPLGLPETSPADSAWHVGKLFSLLEI